MISRFPRLRHEDITLSWNNFNGVFWVTMKTVLEKNDFGDIEDGVMNLTVSGMVLKRMLENAHLHFPMIAMPAFVIFPNGFDAILILRKRQAGEYKSQDIVDIINDFALRLRLLSRNSKRSLFPVDINVWADRLRKIERNEVSVVYDIFASRISTWVDVHQ
jgi:hypothetical protein